MQKRKKVSYFNPGLTLIGLPGPALKVVIFHFVWSSFILLNFNPLACSRLLANLEREREREEASYKTPSVTN